MFVVCVEYTGGKEDALVGSEFRIHLAQGCSAEKTCCYRAVPLGQPWEVLDTCLSFPLHGSVWVRTLGLGGGGGKKLSPVTQSMGDGP